MADTATRPYTLPPAPKVSPEARKKLKPRQIKAIHAYTDPDSPTSGNKVQSYLTAFPEQTNYESAVVQSQRLFGNSMVLSETERILEELGYSYEVRTAEIARAAGGHATDEVVVERYDADGTLKGKTVTRAPVPHTARVQYHKMLMSLTGATDRARALGKAQADEITAASRGILRRIKARRAEAVDAEIVHESREAARGEAQPPEAIESHVPQGGERSCAFCAATLVGMHANRKYCSKRCRDAAAVKRAQAKITTTLSMYTEVDTLEGGVPGGNGERGILPSPFVIRDPENLGPLVAQLRASGVDLGVLISELSRGSDENPGVETGAESESSCLEG